MTRELSCSPIFFLHGASRACVLHLNFLTQTGIKIPSLPYVSVMLHIFLYNKGLTETLGKKYNPHSFSTYVALCALLKHESGRSVRSQIKLKHGYISCQGSKSPKLLQYSFNNPVATLQQLEYKAFNSSELFCFVYSSIQRLDVVKTWMHTSALPHTGNPNWLRSSSY